MEKAIANIVIQKIVEFDWSKYIISAYNLETPFDISCNIAMNIMNSIPHARASLRENGYGHILPLHTCLIK